jgi:SET domain-containing protein
MSKPRRKATKSPWVVTSRSGIHGRGLFARKAIPEDTRVIEYVGNRVTKRQALKIENERAEREKRGGDGCVYTFILNSRYDIDGDVYWNTARLANHSCEPNCVANVIRGKIWIIALRDIAKGEELTYDYNYDWVDWRNNPCRCGTAGCPGYIMRSDLRWRLKRRLARERAAA